MEIIMNQNLAKKQCDAILLALVGSSAVEQWWSSTNRAFDNRTPQEQWTQDYIVVYHYLMAQVSGGYS
jgi:hypothetical protein